MLNLTHSDERRDLCSFPEAKVLNIKQDCILGKHYHKLKTEYFILSEGECILLKSPLPVKVEGGTSYGLTESGKMEIGKLYEISANTYHEFHIKAGSVLIGLNSMPFTGDDDYKP